MKKGLLILNLGTPEHADLSSVRSFLREFLNDPRVIDLPTWCRTILVNGFIIPFRSKRTHQAYQSIWNEHGSPLRYYGEALCTALKQTMGDDIQIALGMRYGSPSLTQALHQLASCQHITILPLYPQYASASTGSSLEAVMRLIASMNVIPSLSIIQDFYQHPAYIQAQAALIQPYLNTHAHILFSYHGIPQRQLFKSGCHRACTNACHVLHSNHSSCYRAQCFETSRLIGEYLSRSSSQYTTAFQSRLGKTPWIKPYTDETLPILIEQGIRDLIVVCPSFMADCLETLEEIDQRLKAQWFEEGGKSFQRVPCFNDHKEAVQLLKTLYLQHQPCHTPHQ